MSIRWEAIELTECIEKDMLPIVVNNGGKGDENV